MIKKKRGKFLGKFQSGKRKRECHKIFPFAGKGKGINVGRIKNSKMGSPKGKLKTSILKKNSTGFNRKFCYFRRSTNVSVRKETAWEKKLRVLDKRAVLCCVVCGSTTSRTVEAVAEC